MHFAKIGCVFFSMDIRIFGSLTTNACRVGGTQEVSIFERICGSADLWIHCYQQRIRYLTICDLTICNLTALTLPLLPCCHYLTVVAPWRCLFLSGSTDLWIHCYQQRICYLTTCNLTMHFLKSGVCFSPWIFGYLDPWLPIHVELVAPWRCLFLSGSTDLWIHCY